jgi:PilZ domain
LRKESRRKIGAIAQMLGEPAMEQRQFATAEGSDRRNHERTPLLYSGSLYDGERTVDCVIRDISLSGARLLVERRIAQQERFILDIDGVGLIPSKIVWQTRDQAGIAFLSDPGTVKSWISAAWGSDALPA